MAAVAVSSRESDELRELADTVYDLIKDIKDPEKPETLEDLNVVYEDGVSVSQIRDETCVVRVEFVPTVPHCSLATLIGLCIRVRLQRGLPQKHKLDIVVKEGSHDSALEVTKQVNDKERVAAALENPNLRELVDQCLEQDY